VEASAQEHASTRQRADAPLGTLIYRAGLLTEEQLEQALTESMKTGRRLGQVLLQWGWLTEADLGRLLAGQRGLEFVSLATMGIDPEAARLLPEETIRLYRTLPIAVEGDAVVVAVEDPKDEVAMEAASAALDREIRFVVATRTELLEAIGEPTTGPPASAATEPTAVPVSAGVWLGLRLVGGERIEIGSFPDEDAARGRAEEIIGRLAETGGAEWLCVSGRYFNPGTIVSLDLDAAGR
jgi:Type II secretion system (T2SS), protein E, N-terminal domain